MLRTYAHTDDHYIPGFQIRECSGRKTGNVVAKKSGNVVVEKPGM